MYVLLCICAYYVHSKILTGVSKRCFKTWLSKRFKKCALRYEEKECYKLRVGQTVLMFGRQLFQDPGVPHEHSVFSIAVQMQPDHSATQLARTRYTTRSLPYQQQSVKPIFPQYWSYMETWVLCWCPRGLRQGYLIRAQRRPALPAPWSMRILNVILDRTEELVDRVYDTTRVVA